MSDQRREKQLHQALQNMLKGEDRPALPPEVQQVIAMDPVARQAVFGIDMLRTIVSGQMNLLGLVGGHRFFAPLLQVQGLLEKFRTQIMEQEASPIVVVQPGDAPKPPVA